MAKPMSTRAFFRLFQAARESQDAASLDSDLRLLQAKDLDLSIRLGAVLAFDALLIGTAIQPAVASPGAPLALDAATQPVFTLLTMVAVACLALAGFLAVRGITLGEEFSDEGLADRPEIMIQRLYAAYCLSIDRQRRLLTLSIRLTVGGVLLTALLFLLVLGDKLR
jgi:hypothetical protein